MDTIINRLLYSTQGMCEEIKPSADYTKFQDLCIENEHKMTTALKDSPEL